MLSVLSGLGGEISGAANVEFPVVKNLRLPPVERSEAATESWIDH